MTYKKAILQKNNPEKTKIDLMKHSIALFFLWILTVQGEAQSVIASTGSEGNAGNMNINYSVGEVAITTLSNDTITLTQGFHQPYFVITAIKETFLPGEIKVFPSPTTSILHVQLDGIGPKNLIISLHDLTGKVFFNSDMNTANWQTDLSRMPGGIYIITIADTKSNKSSSYKILKSN